MCYRIEFVAKFEKMEFASQHFTTGKKWKQGEWEQRKTGNSWFYKK